MKTELSIKRRWVRRGGRLCILLLASYLGVIVFFASLQRSMIYASRPGVVVADAELVRAGLLEEVMVTSDDGLPLHGWLLHTHPASPDENPVPSVNPNGLVIVFPGNAGNRSNRLAMLQDLTRCGWDALIFDYRGYGDNAGQPGEKAIAADALTIWKYACDTLGYRPEQIVLSGQSLGGGVATRLAWDLKQQGISPAGLILRATFTSLADAASRLYPWLPVRTVLLDRYPSIDRIGALTCPILMIHGRLDTIVPFVHGEKLFAAAPQRSASGISKTFLELPHCGHNDLQIHAAKELHLAHSDFLRKIERSREPDAAPDMDGAQP